MPGLGLAALTRLRALTLRQTWAELAELRAGDLPPSLEELKLVMQFAHDVDCFWTDLPLFVGFDRLHNLRRITLSECRDLEFRWHPAMLPPSLEVCAPLAPRAFQQSPSRIYASVPHQNRVKCRLHAGFSAKHAVIMRVGGC